LHVKYERLKKIHDHLRREHGLPEGCEAIHDLWKLWVRGCDEAVTRHEDRMDEEIRKEEKRKRGP